MRAIDIIVKKRDGSVLDREEIAFFVDGVVSGTIPSYQASALLMAIVIRGMTPEETWSLTGAMARSGPPLDLQDVPGIKVDKHSTGGVGDKTSLIVAPIVAACGVTVPMMSGRGLGHTGGTLDKLESIPGFRVGLSLLEMKAALRTVGCALVGQTATTAPADRILYALRDATGTVESLPLICASIMSKKMAGGADALVLDVKAGRGAFLQSAAESRRLADALVATGHASGLKTEALITQMDSPLGSTVGNALEVVECFDVLRGGGPSDLVEVSVALASRMLMLGGAARDEAAADVLVREAIDSGAGLERLRRIIESQGGDSHVIDDPARLSLAPCVRRIGAPRGGFVTGLDARLIGRAAGALGAGRDRVEDTIDPGVGIRLLVKPGAEVRAGDPVLELVYRRTATLDGAVALASRAIEMGDLPPAVGPVILGRVI